MPQYRSLVLLCVDGSASTWNVSLVSSSNTIPGGKSITPGSPTRIGANGCITLLVQRKLPTYAWTFSANGRSAYRTLPNTLAKVSQGMLGVFLAHATSSGASW